MRRLLRGKKVSIVLVLCLVLGAFAGVAAGQSNQDLTVKLTINSPVILVNGQESVLDTAPYINTSTSRTMVPIRFVTEALGASVTWVSDTKQVVVTSGDNEVVVTVGSNTASVNGVDVTTDTSAALLPPGRVFVPLRFISEAFNADVHFSALTKEITITNFPMNFEKIILFFSDVQVQHAMPEQREVYLGGRTLLQAIMEELLAGPQDPYLYRGIPEGITVHSTKLDNGTVTVDFDSSLIEKFPSGSASQSMFFTTLLFTLTELEGVEQIVIKVDGEIPEVLGQYSLEGPLTRGPIVTSPILLDPDRSTWLQQEAEEGRQTWRFDPLMTAQFDGKMAGFTDADVYTLLSSGSGEAEVEVNHKGIIYQLTLTQPVKTGATGIWVITSIQAK